jgi:hypothetical protein
MFCYFVPFFAIVLLFRNTANLPIKKQLKNQSINLYTVNRNSVSWYDKYCFFIEIYILKKDRRDRDPMVVGFTTTCSISAYHH